MNQNSTEKGQILYLIERYPDHARYFWARVRSLDWFTILKEQNCFDTKNIQYDLSSRTTFWPVLDYLEKVSEQITADSNQEYGKELIEIIDSIVQSSQKRRAEKGKGINNYYIWWCCEKILNNIPCDIIKKELPSDKLRDWLYEWISPDTDGELVADDIAMKLLPKFLKDDSMPEYAEVLVGAIIQIRPSGNKTPITGRYDVTLVCKSYWVAEAFRKNHKDIGLKCSIKVIYNIADTLKQALEYKQSNYIFNIEANDGVYQIEVSRVPAGSVEMTFNLGKYQGILRKFSAEQVKGIDRENNFWMFYTIKPEEELCKFSFFAEDKNSFIKQMKSKMPPDIARMKDSGEGLEHIFDGLFSDHSRTGFESLSRGKDLPLMDAEDVLITALRDVLISKCEADDPEGRKVLETFLSTKYPFPIFRRIVLFFMDKFWAKYYDVWDKYFKVVPDALAKSAYEVELQDILRNHNKDFDEGLVCKIKALINEVPNYYKEKLENGEKYWKYKWLSPLKEHPEFADDYKKFAEDAHKPYEPDYGTLSGLVTHQSPLSKEEILQKPIPILVDYLIEFKGADFWGGSFEGKPDRDGLAGELYNAVQSSPEQFLSEIELFHKAPQFYINSLLGGLIDAWKSGKEIDIAPLFDFYIKYLSKDKETFVKEVRNAQGEDTGAHYILIINTMMAFIEDGCWGESKRLDDEYWEVIGKVFEKVLPLVSAANAKIEGDAVSYALNTTFGKYISAFIAYSRRQRQKAGAELKEWGDTKYERYFKQGFEAYIWFGHYLSVIKYIDKEYAERKIKEFAALPPSDYNWQLFIEGYLYSHTLYDVLYALMRDNYEKALNFSELKVGAGARLVEHICLGFLEYDEDWPLKTDESLFHILLQSPDVKRWQKMVDFFWSHSSRTENNASEPTDETKKRIKIKKFWQWLYDERNKVQSLLGVEYEAFLGDLVKLIVVLDTIDAASEQWILLSAPHVRDEHGAYVFIDHLAKIEDADSIVRIGRIYRKMLNFVMPTFQDENIKTIVDNIYKKGSRTDAEEICNTYARRGFHFLRDIWEKYHPDGSRGE